MCGRYTLSVSNKPAIAELGLQSADRFNIAPQSQVLIQKDSGDHASVHWGIPMGGSKASRLVTNARFETLDAKPLFRDVARCALLTDGWYEWQRVGAKKSLGTTIAAGAYFIWRVCISPVSAARWSPRALAKH